MAQQVVTELVIDARTAAAGAAQYDAAMKKAEAAAQRVVSANDNAQAAIERSTVSMSQSTSRQATAWQRMAAAADPVIAATQRLEKATIAGNAAMARGVASADQVAAVLSTYRAQLDAASGAAVRGGAATALNAGQVQNLSFQMNDMATMLASGQNPFVMLMQQGMQMAQVFGPGVGVGAALKATGGALVSFLTNPLTLAVIGIAAAAGAVKLLWDAVSNSASAERVLEEHKALIDDIRDAYGEAGDAATRYAAKSAEVLQFRTSNTLSNEVRALNAALADFATTNNPFEVFNPSQVAADFGPLNGMVLEFIRTIEDGTADVAAFERSLALVGNATEDISTDAAVGEVLALIDPLLKLEQQARQTAGATQLFAGTLVTLGRAGTLRFADAFGDLEGMNDELTGFLGEQNRAAEESARIATQRADAIRNVAEELSYETDQLGRTAREQAIYNALRQAGTTLDTAAGREIAALAGNLYDAEKAQDALNKRMQEAKGLAEGFTGSLVSGLLKGEGIVSAIGSAVSGMSSSLGNMASDFLGKIGGTGTFGSILSGVGGGLVSSVASSIGSIVDSLFGNAELDAWRAMKGEVNGFIGELNKGAVSLDQAKDQYREMIAAAEAAGQSGAKVDRLTRAFEKFKKEAEAAEKAARKAELTSTLQDYGDRAYVAGLDTSTIEGRLAQFDLAAQREREKVIEDGGKKLNKRLAALDQALAAERLKIQSDYQQEAIDSAKRAADEMNQTARSIVEYVNGLKTGSDSPLAPVDRFNAAQSAYQAQVALAQGGNADALGSITQYSDAYLKAAREMYASSEAFFDIFDTVTAQLLALPAAQGATAPDVVAMLQVLDAVLAQTSVLQAQTATLAGAINAGPVATANALAPLFDTIDIDASGGITLAEMQAALGTTNERLLAIFTELDANGNGTISRLELLAKDSSLSNLAKDATISGVVKTGDVSALDQLPGIKTGIGDVNTNVGKDDASGLKRWTKNAALAAKAADKTLGTWIPVMANRLYEIADFTGQAKGVKEKPSKGPDQFKGRINAPGYTAPFAQGGIVGRYATGGVVGNGMWNVDSVLARYAGGGSVALAGGEGVINAAATSMIGPSVIDLINRTGRLPDNDNGRYFDTQNRVLMAGFRAMVEEVKALREEVEMLRAETRGTTQAIRDKPVPKKKTALG